MKVDLTLSVFWILMWVGIITLCPTSAWNDLHWAVAIAVTFGPPSLMMLPLERQPK